MIQKQTLDISFAAGLDTKTDPWRVSPENFLALENQVFTKGGRLTKRNGYQQLINAGSDADYITTLNDNLLIVGDTIQAYDAETNSAISNISTSFSPLNMGTLPLLRNSLNQTQCDSAVSSNGLVCFTYTELNPDTTLTRKVAISDSVTGQSVFYPIDLNAVAIGASTDGSARVFAAGNYFIVVFSVTTGGGSQLQYLCLSQTTGTQVAVGVIASSYVAATTVSWDGFVVEENLYVAYNTTSGGQAVNVTYIAATTAAAGGSPHSPTTFSGIKATIASVTADISTPSNPTIWINVYRSDTSLGKVMAVDQNLNTLLSPHTTIASGTVNNITSACYTDGSGYCYLFVEVSNFYGFDANVPSNYIKYYRISPSGSVTSPQVVIRSVGLASKAFFSGSSIYFLSEYLSAYQPTYFLFNFTTNIVSAELAYQNGGTVAISSSTRGYLPIGLPSVSVLNSNQCYVSYLFKDLVTAVNKDTNVSSSVQVNGIYSQTGVNLAKIELESSAVVSSELGRNLLLSGGFLWMYDGYVACENNFFLYPDNVEATPSASGGSLDDQIYFYQVTYEWTDNQGNIYRSAPSIPLKVTVSGGSGSGSVTLHIPTIRVTNKVANNNGNDTIKIVVYRWSVAQQVYYQTTSITAPTLNDTSADSVDFVDTNSDATILGNNIIYTNGGVVENTGAPGSNVFALFDNRLWLVDAEDKNLLWFSKQVIENVPVEMSDLFTYFVAPTSGAQQSTGEIGALAPMDDKLIIFKDRPGIYYINGTGPDNTGANSQYSQPIFITTTTGCDNPASVILTPVGVMFQALNGKGIWLVDRSLQTSYIGAPVEQYNDFAVTSAVNVPNANQVRFTLNNGKTLVYDYYYQQWSTFSVNAISSCIYSGLHTFLGTNQTVYQENPGSYLDGTEPVLLSLTTSWFKLSGMQGYQRSYFFYLLGQYYSPHKLAISIAYDFNSSPEESVIVSPTNYSGTYGGSSDPYGSSAYYGGTTEKGASVERWRVFLKKQRCEAFQITAQEVFDSSFGVMAGQGLSLSGLLLVYGAKKAYRPFAAVHSTGANS